MYFPQQFLNLFFIWIINFSLSKKVVIGWWASEQCVDDIIQHNNKSRLELFEEIFTLVFLVLADALLDRPDVAGPGAPGDRLPLHPLLLLQLHHAQAEAGAG